MPESSWSLGRRGQPCARMELHGNSPRRRSTRDEHQRFHYASATSRMEFAYNERCRFLVPIQLFASLSGSLSTRIADDPPVFPTRPFDLPRCKRHIFACTSCTTRRVCTNSRNTIRGQTNVTGNPLHCRQHRKTKL